MVTGTSYSGASILGLEAGRLRFLTASGKVQTPWISEVDWMIIDRGVALADLNEAEQYVSHDDPGRAIERYRRALRTSDPSWAELIEVRLLSACDHAGRLGESAQAFIRVVRGAQSGPAVAARLIPDVPIRKKNAAAGRAVQILDTAIEKAETEETKAMYRLLRFDVLRLTDDQRAAADAPNVVALTVPSDARSRRVFDIKLAALTIVAAGSVDAVWWDGLDRAIRVAPQENLAGLLMLKGRTLAKHASTREDMIRASWPLMRVAIHLRDDPAVAEALYEAALIVERLGRLQKAVVLLAECLAHKSCDEPVRGLASEAMVRVREALARVGPSSGS